jgi:diguanylate cyclase (GGDEF)-like protein
LMHAQGWFAAGCLAVIVDDAPQRTVVMAERGPCEQFREGITRVARWVTDHNEEFMSASLDTDRRIGAGPAAAVLAFPLRCRARTIGALVALDPVPSLDVPKLSAPLLATLRVLLEGPALAIDTTMQLQRGLALSVTDDLTGLYNSRYLKQVLHRECKRASRSGRPLSLLFIDLDGFKYVNDNHGHLSGSRALVETADVMRGCARETDVVARFGGDEFAVVLPDTGSEGAVAVGERYRERISAHPFLASERLDIHLTASVGVATLPDMAGSAEELIKAADTAMYRVKDRGKNGVLLAIR